MTPYAEVIGDPIGHSLSPALHRFWLDRLGVDGDYRALRVQPHELADYFAVRRADPQWRGCNITMPLKLAALAHAPHRTDPSFPVEAISLAVRKPDGSLEGHALDAMALVHSLWNAPSQLQPGPAVILGAGGAAGAATWALAHFSTSPIWIRARSPERAAAFVERRSGIGARVLPADAPLPPAAILINATPQGMAGYGEVEEDLSTLPGDAIVYDMVYAPLETGLLRRARARGLATMDGLDMLVPQAAISFQHLFGTSVPPNLWQPARRAALA